MQHGKLTSLEMQVEAHRRLLSAVGLEVQQTPGVQGASCVSVVDLRLPSRGQDELEQGQRLGNDRRSITIDTAVARLANAYIQVDDDETEIPLLQSAIARYAERIRLLEAEPDTAREGPDALRRQATPKDDQSTASALRIVLEQEVRREEKYIERSRFSISRLKAENQTTLMGT